MKIAVFVVLCLLAASVCAQDGKKVGFVFSGGGSRVAQEVAVLEALMTGDFPGGKPLRPTFASGTSAGSLCSVAVSALLKSMDGKSRMPFTFDTLKSMIFNMTVGTVVDVSPLGIYKILSYNVGQGYLLDTAPLRVTLTKYLEIMEIKYMSDLYIPTCISVVDITTGLPIRICSDDPTNAKTLVLDVVMSSTAMPVIFPQQTIANFKPPFGGGVYVDGGVGIDMIPSDSAYLRKLDEVYIVTRQWELNNATSLPLKLQNVKLLANAINTFNNFLQAAFLAGLSSAYTAKMPTYSYIPVLDVDFGVLDFDQGKVMYELTRAWTRKNAPICMTCRPAEADKKIIV